MYERAFSYRKQKLFHLCFFAWLEFHYCAKRKIERRRAQIEVATAHCRLRTLRVHIKEWKIFSVQMAKRREQATTLLKCVANVVVLRLVFKSWLDCSKASSQSKKWFRVYEQNAEGFEDMHVWYYDEGCDPISLLPIEVSTKIFIFVGLQNLSLFKCATVCRSWKEIIDHPLLWNKLDLSKVKNRLEDDILLKLIVRSRPFLGHLNLRGALFITQRSISAIGQCQNLQDLNLSECSSLTDKALNDVLTGCTGLLYLNLSYCPITDNSLIVMSRHCTNLRFLSLAYCTQFTSKGLHYVYVRKGCKKVNYIDLSGCEQLTPECMRFIGGAFPVLNTIVLDDIPLINDEMVIAFVSQCQTLRRITFRGGSLITDKAVKLLALQSRKLKSIQIENNSLISDVSLKALGKVCRNLEAVNVSGCSKITDHGLKALSHLRSLVVINVADCVRISDPGIRHIIESPSGPSLRELNLTNCYKISDVTLLRLSQRYVCSCMQ
jgi:F-box/leucine-rich repeat protein 13